MLKGVSTLVPLVLILIVGTVVGGVAQKIIGVAEDENSELQEQLNRFSREITLSEEPSEAKEQIESLLHFNALRAAHCGMLYEAEQNNPDLIKQDKLGPFSNLPCQDEERYTNVNNPAANLPELLGGDYVAEDGQDQEGKYGNIAFKYPGDEPLIYTTDEVYMEEDEGTGIDFGLEPYVTNVDNADFSGLRDPAHASAYAWLYHHTDEKGQFNYIPDEKIVKWSQVKIAKMTERRWRVSDVSPPPYDGYEGHEEFPIPSYAPQMKNVPVVNATPLVKNGVILPEGSSEMIVCPGAEGRIQANAAEPYNEGEATGSDAEKKIYPFLEVTDSSRSCVEDKAGNAEGLPASRILSPSNMRYGVELEQEKVISEGSSLCRGGEIVFGNGNGDNPKIEFSTGDECMLNVAYGDSPIKESVPLQCGEDSECNSFYLEGGENSVMIVDGERFELPNDRPVKVTELPSIQGFETKMEFEKQDAVISFSNNDVRDDVPLKTTKEGRHVWAVSSLSIVPEELQAADGGEYSCDSYSDVGMEAEDFEKWGKTVSVTCGLNEMQLENDKGFHAELFSLENMVEVVE